MNKLIMQLGIANMITCTILAYITFFWTFINGYEIILKINQFNEAIPELIIMVILLIPTIIVSKKLFLLNKKSIEVVK